MANNKTKAPVAKVATSIPVPRQLSQEFGRAEEIKIAHLKKLARGRFGFPALPEIGEVLTHGKVKHCPYS